MDIADHLQRLLLFTPEVYAAVFGQYHAATWPVSLAGLAACVLLAGAAWRGIPAAVRLVPFLLAALWLWTGVVFHGFHYATVNWAGPVFAVLFAVASLWLAWTGWRTLAVPVVVTATCRRCLGFAWTVVVLAWCGFAALLATWTGVSSHRAGLTPDSAAWLTVGLAPLGVRSGIAVLSVALLWLPLGAVTALLLHDVASLIMHAAALAVLGAMALCRRLR